MNTILRNVTFSSGDPRRDPAGLELPAQQCLSPPCMRREKDLRKHNSSQKKKEKKLINSVSCPEAGKESKQPLLQMTLLLASCREVSVFLTKTGARQGCRASHPTPTHPGSYMGSRG